MTDRPDLELEPPTTPGGARRIVERTAPPRPVRAAAPPPPVAEPARLAAPGPELRSAPAVDDGDEPLRDYLGRVIELEGTEAATDDELAAAVTTLAHIPSTWLALGDSITEGMGATDRAHRWINRAVDGLRAVTGVGGGVGYVPAWQNTGWADYTAPWSHPSGAGNVNWGKVLGGKVTLIPAGKSSTLTVVGTAVDVWVQLYGGAPVMAVSVDGGPELTMPTHSAVEGPARLRVPMGSSGPHTVTVRADGTIDLALAGAMVYDGDENDGLRLYEAAFSGWSSAQVAGLADQNLTPARLQQLAGMVAPDLITIDAGLNDLLIANLAPADLVANVDRLAATMRAAAPRARIVLVECYAPADMAAQWQPYLDGLRGWASAHRSIEVLDLADLMGPTTRDGLWNGDGLHPTNAGSQRIADHLVDLIVR